MSASLVGSEMCIRDSSRTSNGRDSRRKLGARARGGHSRKAASRHGAASYTHLTLPTICSV
eukprot:1164018-Alexandrium_andersonii.AAC.1